MANKSIFKNQPFIEPATAKNEAGGAAYTYDSRHALSQLAATGCLNRTFYATAETQLQQIVDLANKVDPAFLAKTAIFSRERGYMKDMPALLTAILSMKMGGKQYDNIFSRVINNGKMLRNFVQIMRSGTIGRRSLGTAPKRNVLNWFASRSPEQIFRNSVGNSPSFADILKMVHPNPESVQKEALYGWILGKKHDEENLPSIVREFEKYKAGDRSNVPDVPFEMLTALDLDCNAWTEIAKNARWQWLRMNLNTLQRHGVLAKPEMVELIAEKLVDQESIAKANVFPYQLLAAYLNIGVEIPQKIRNALQDALEIATANVPRVDGKVYVLVDVSGSMSHPVTGHRAGSTSKVSCVDVAALISSVILRKNDEAEVIPFSDHVKTIALNPRDSVMTNAQNVRAMLGGGTACSAPMKMLNDKNAKGDLVFLVSDNMSWVETYGYGYGNAAERKETALMKEWTTFRKRNKQAKLVVLDIQPGTTTQAYEREDILNIGGFSDNVFEIVSAFANGELDCDHWVGEIEKIEI